MNVKAILFDSGKVLNGPATGHWFITPNFFEFVDKKAFYRIPKSQIEYAFLKAGEYISVQSLILTEEEEYKHFVMYYTIFFERLSSLNIDHITIEKIAWDLVYNYDKYCFYKDVPEVLAHFSLKYKLAIVSDAWPSLENVFRNAGHRDYFSSFVISSQKGVTKPHELMYEAALAELSIKPSEAVFIDDSIKNCDGARNLGIHSILICRDFKSFIYYKMTCKNHKVIRSLKELKKCL